MSKEKECPTVPVIKSCINPTSRGFRVVEVRCPYCGKMHTHGAAPNAVIGSRVAHCIGPREGINQYFIEGTVS